MSVTAIVVTYNSGHVLPFCLDALDKEGIEVLIVDNASDDFPTDYAARYSLLKNAKNEGYGRANNRGVQAVASEFVLIINPDIVLEPGAIRALLEAAHMYPDAGMYAPRLVEPDGRLFFQGRSLISPSVVKGFSGFRHKAVLPSGDCSTAFLSGACFLMRRELFLTIGGFDPHIFLFYEDDDLCRRVRDAGFALLHVHEAVARHGRGHSTRKKPGSVYKIRWHLAWSRAYILRKYGFFDDSLGLFLLSCSKCFLSLFSFRRALIERYAGSAAGSFAALRSVRAVDYEYLDV